MLPAQFMQATHIGQLPRRAIRLVGVEMEGARETYDAPAALG